MRIKCPKCNEYIQISEHNLKRLSDGSLRLKVFGKSGRYYKMNLFCGRRANWGWSCTREQSDTDYFLMTEKDFNSLLMEVV